MPFEPENLVCVDFETYYSTEFTLSKLATDEYIRDPRFETIGVGVKVNAGQTVWTDDAGFRAWASKVDWSKCAVLAHNSAFDAFILAHQYGIHPGFIFDTLSMARAIHGTEVGGSLAKLMVHYGVGEKGNEVINARGKRRKDFTPEEYARYGEYCRGDVEGCYNIFQAMIERGFPEAELRLIDITMKMFTQPKFILDEPLLQQFLTEEIKRKADLLDRIAKDKSVLMSNDKFAQLLLELEEIPPRKVSAAKSKTAGHPVETWAFAKSDIGMQMLLEHEREEIRWVAEARVGVKSTINETRAERFLRMGHGGRRMPVMLRYYGAHTGRWSAGGKTNFQNLQRVDKKKPGSGALRKSLLAPRGKVIVVADSAQIEARVIAWLAGHDSLVQAFAQGRDVYSEFATELYGRPIDRKNNPEDFIPGFLGKIAILGLGFGLGWLKLSETLLKGMLGGPSIRFTEQDAQTFKANVGWFRQDEKKLARIENMPSRLSIEDRIIHCAVANAIVRKYRTKNEPITKLWQLMEVVLGAMNAGEEGTFGPGEILRTTRHGIVLPNDMTLRYPGLRESEDGEGFSYMGGHAGKERVRAYGGSITENVVQALARIIVGEQMLEAHERYGYPVASMAHDEIVFVVDEAEGDSALKNVIQIMKTPPKWAPGLPLSAEGGVGKSYGGAK